MEPPGAQRDSAGEKGQQRGPLWFPSSPWVYMCTSSRGGATSNRNPGRGATGRGEGPNKGAALGCPGRCLGVAGAEPWAFRSALGIAPPMSRPGGRIAPPVSCSSSRSSVASGQREVRASNTRDTRGRFNKLVCIICSVCRRRCRGTGKSGVAWPLDSQSLAAEVS